MNNYWITVLSHEHALRGIEGGFMQACHGKSATLKRMKAGDWVTFYCPKKTFMGNDSYQHFVGLGKVSTGDVYQVSMTEDFHPYRLDIDFITGAKDLEASIIPLISKLNFIQDKQHWGAPFRFGHFKISEEDFKVITDAMKIVI